MRERALVQSFNCVAHVFAKAGQRVGVGASCSSKQQPRDASVRELLSLKAADAVLGVHSSLRAGLDSRTVAEAGAESIRPGRGRC